MSVFGGDSWARENQHRKRKVEDLLLSSSSSSPSSSKKLSNGKFVCLICPHNPTLDSLLMLSMHNKGSRHIESEKKLKEKEVLRKQELDKRIALSSKTSIKSNKTNSNYNPKTSTNQDKVDETRSAILELRSNKLKDLNDKKLGNLSYLDPYERREKELKFIESGWKRDGFGKWYRDENVEFDSDEEDPNTCLG